MSLYEDYIAVSRYARNLPEKKRREIWPETVDRYIKFFSDFTNPKLEFLREPIQTKAVLPLYESTDDEWPCVSQGSLALLTTAPTLL